ncbi:high affinity copper uptake protein 1-like isoform X2 [Neodiprion virginianus]|nr:high affinity copper uptake protein 1-like isoform X2 [Neodiprion fabricii]XP_046423167.1 high affinity copper uptake protein 1-like isoform X2 [Neodiprion fabricii]XP_046423168.1 high affinity copper uptake protein 1-like isoform X2 [Neodiprion fabricii]XP_046614118.1 high affinity copper uptake protein 1-like isoform X2 [Neodiprion virginianus]XP_046614119.1 high affinity copper uptake protein 1-like isoform X2 [Neodiprion virginianus]XP_046614120.1 high affinity copper uptake protein 1-l
MSDDHLNSSYGHAGHEGHTMGHAGHEGHMMGHAGGGGHSGSMEHVGASSGSSAEACSGHGMHGMMMAFHGGYCETVLFDSWKVSSIGSLVGSMIGIIIMAALYEGLKYYREYLFWRTYNALQYRSVSMPQEKNVVSEDNRVVHFFYVFLFSMVGEVIHKQPPTMLSWMHTFQTFLHIVQIIISYFLMLIFMTYNVWLCFAVVLGAAVGYFLFGWKKSVIVDVTEHCH